MDLGKKLPPLRLQHAGHQLSRSMPDRCAVLNQEPVQVTRLHGLLSVTEMADT